MLVITGAVMILTIEASPVRTKPDQPDRKNISTLTTEINTKQLLRSTTAALKQIVRAIQTIWILLKAHVSNAITT